MNKWSILLGLIVTTNLTLYADTLEVQHIHEPWGECQGDLIIDQAGIQYRSGKESHSRSWSWRDIQGFDRKSDQRFSLMTYEDEALRLGLDRHYDFRVVPGTEPLGEASFALISEQLARPVTDRVVPSALTGFQIPVKHLHSMGGCEGTLFIDQDRISFSSDTSRHNRSWIRGRDIHSVWSMHRYQLEVHVFEANRRNTETLRSFRFTLKVPLQKTYYEELRRELAADW